MEGGGRWCGGATFRPIRTRTGAEGRKRITGAPSPAPSEGAPVIHDPGHLRRSPGISSDFIRRRPSTTNRSSAVVNSIPTRKREASPGTTPPTRSGGTPFLFLRFHPIHIPPVSRDGRKWDDLRGRREHRHRRSRHRHGRFAQGHHPSTRSRVRWTNIPAAGTSVRTKPRSYERFQSMWEPCCRPTSDRPSARRPPSSRTPDCVYPQMMG